MSESFIQTLEGSMFIDGFRRAGGVRVDLWWLERGDGTATFLYGWILPYSVRAPILKIANARRQLRDSLAIAVWSFEGSIDQIIPQVRQWVAGEGLGAVPPAVGSWYLPIGEMTPAPLTFDLPRARANMSTPSERGAPSPLSEAPALCVGLARVAKAALFEGVGFAAEEIVSTLTALVGFDFVYDHARRLGNLEAFTFPSSKPDEHSAVDFTFRGSSLRIAIDRTLIPATLHAIVRCSERANGRVLSDRVRVVSWTELTEPIELTMSDGGPWVTTVDIWVSPDGQDASPWFSDVFVPMRSVSITTRVSDAGLPGPGWLAAWGARKEIARVDTGLSRLQDRERTATLRDYPAWFNADLNAHELARLLAPPMGSDRLLLGGVAELANEGRLGELVGMLAPGETSDVLLVDPMFDDYGLALLAKLGFNQVAYHVLTTLSPARRDASASLVALARASMLPIEVGAIEFGDEVVTPIGCYLIMLDASGKAHRGFQLSTSLSFTTRNLPLLINQLDPGALGAVAEWIRALQRCDAAFVGPRARFTTLWPQAAQVIDTNSRKVDHSQVADALAALEGDLGDDAWALRWKEAAGLLANFANHEKLLADIPLTIVSRVEALLGDVDRLAMLPGRSERVSSSSYYLLDSLLLSTRVQYHRAWDMASRWGEHSAWWSVWIAAETLLRASPSAMVRVLDGYVVRLALPGDQRTATRITCVSVLLYHIVRALHGASVNVAQLEPELLASKTALVQGLGVASVGRRIVDVLEDVANSDLAALERLPVENRICALAECVYRLRVRANRAGGESGRDEHVRSILFVCLLELWPHARPDLREMVFHLEGPVIGAWAASTTFDLLLPLVERNYLALQDVVGLWAGELGNRWLRLLEGNYYFYLNADGPLTLLVAKLVSQPGPADTLVDYARALASEARTVLHRPFSKSTDYERWSRARDGLTWLRAFAQLLNRSDDPRVQPLLVPVPTDSTIEEIDPSKLYQFARDVDRRSPST